MPASKVRFSAVMATGLSTNPEPKLRFTGDFVNYIGDQGSPLRHLTQVNLTYLAIRAPNMRWISVILEDVFPNDISYNSVGTIRFATDVIVVDSGDDQRIQRWDQPLLEFDVSYGVRTMEQLQDMIAFFRAMRGRLYAFNYRDWLDYTSSMAVAYEAREAPPISGMDQFQFVGDGSTYVFQLVKNYVAPRSGTTLTRPITRPDAPTVRVTWTGELDGDAEDWTDHVYVDPETGICRLLPRHTITASNVTKSAGFVGQSIAITGTGGLFEPYRRFAADRRKLEISGFAVGENNVTASQTAVVSAISDDNNTLYVVYGQGGTIADTAINFTISIHPAPPAGVSVYAGYQFYVPVRFDTDQLPLTLEDYGVGSAQSIKLVEVRPTAF